MGRYCPSYGTVEIGAHLMSLVSWCSAKTKTSGFGVRVFINSTLLIPVYNSDRPSLSRATAAWQAERGTSDRDGPTGFSATHGCGAFARGDRQLGRVPGSLPPAMAILGALFTFFGLVGILRM